MRIVELQPMPDWILCVVADDGRRGLFNLRPYLDDEAFKSLREPGQFERVMNGGYFVEWDCGADLSADTIEAHWRLIEDPVLT